MIYVKTYYNTEADGSPVLDDRELEDMPITYHGPFDDEGDAISFIEDEWPDGDTDIYEQVVVEEDVPPAVVNSPDSIWGDIPDEDIRD